MHQPRDAERGGGLGDGAGAAGLDALEVLPAQFVEDADEVDDRMRALDRGGDGGGVTQIGLHGVDLADHAQRLQKPCEIGPADSDTDPVAALDQRAHHMTAQETGAAEDGDELLAGQ